MKNEEIQSILMKALSLKEIYVSSNENHVYIIAVDEIFHNMNRIKKQQIIYAPLMNYIIDQRIHALTIKTYTPKEWKDISKINDFK